MGVVEIGMFGGRRGKERLALGFVGRTRREIYRVNIRGCY